MARTGRFGNLPSNAPELTSTIVAMFEAAEAAKDRNILNAWQSGGEFEGEKVTDTRLKKHFLSRRAQYDRNEPEWDYWNQQYEQIDYDIGESKVLLQYANGTMNELGVSRWYARNAKRFPKASEAWREAMRNSAAYRKAGQEKAKAGRTISDYDRYTNGVTNIQRTKVDPGIRAMGLLDRVLKQMGLSYNGFMALDANGQAVVNKQIEEFMRHDADGRRFNRDWKRLTGGEFTFGSAARVIRTAKEGSKQQAKVARRYGYSTTQFDNQARDLGTVETAMQTVKADIMDEYVDAMSQFQTDMLAAKSPQERAEARDRLDAHLVGLGKRASDIGNDTLQGQIRGLRINLRGEEGGGVYDNPLPGETLNPNTTQAAGETELRTDANGDLQTNAYGSASELIWASAALDRQNLEKVQKGTATFIDKTGEGDLSIIDNERLGDTPNLRFATDYIEIDGKPTAVLTEWRPVTVTVRSQTNSTATWIMDGVHVANVGGTMVYRWRNAEGQWRTTDYPPFSDEGTMDGFFGDGTQRRVTEEWGLAEDGKPESRGLNVTILVTDEAYARLNAAGMSVTGDTPEMVQQRIDRERASIVAGPEEGEGQRFSDRTQRPGTIEERRGIAATIDWQARHAKAAGYGEEWDAANGRTVPASQRYRNPNAAVQPPPLTPEQEAARSEYVTQHMQADGYEYSEGSAAQGGPQWVTTVERDQQGISGPGRVSLQPIKGFGMPLIISGAVASNDASGWVIRATSSPQQRNWVQTHFTPEEFMDILVEKNHIDKTDAAAMMEAASTTDSIFRAGAAGEDELDWLEQQARSGMGSVVSQMTQLGYERQRASERQSMVERLGLGGATIDEARGLTVEELRDRLTTDDLPKGIDINSMLHEVTQRRFEQEGENDPLKAPSGMGMRLGHDPVPFDPGAAPLAAPGATPPTASLPGVVPPQTFKVPTGPGAIAGFHLPDQQAGPRGFATPINQPVQPQPLPQTYTVPSGPGAIAGFHLPDQQGGPRGFATPIWSALPSYRPPKQAARFDPFRFQYGASTIPRAYVPPPPRYGGPRRY